MTKPTPLPMELVSDSIPSLMLVMKSAVAPTINPVQPIPVAEPQLEDFKGLPLYFDNDEPDKRTRKTATKRSYYETAETFLARQREYREKFTTDLKDNQVDAAEQLIDNFFENEVRNGADRLNLLCELMLTRLQQGQSLEVIVKGYTSPRAESDYNLNLAKRRISSVRNQFEIFDDGSLQPFLRSGKLEISEVSFGETTVKSGISDKLSDERNSIYHPDAARERRVEIVEVHIR